MSTRYVWSKWNRKTTYVYEGEDDFPWWSDYTY